MRPVQILESHRDVNTTTMVGAARCCVRDCSAVCKRNPSNWACSAEAIVYTQRLLDKQSCPGVNMAEDLLGRLDQFRNEICPVHQFLPNERYQFFLGGERKKKENCFKIRKVYLMKNG